jgi:hypothetical protein
MRTPKPKYRDEAGPRVLADLPPHAAIYAAVHLDVLRRIPDDLWDELLARWTQSPVALGRSLGIDPERAVLAAIGSSKSAEVVDVIDAVIKGTWGKPLDRLIAAHDDRAFLYRIIVPLVHGSDSAVAARTLGAYLSGGAELSPCDGGNACAEFEGTKPSGLATRADRVLAAYVTADSVRIDLAVSMFGVPAGHALRTALARFGSTRGGPEAPRCGAFDASGGASLCGDADAAANLGAVIGYSRTLNALRTPDIRRELVRKLAQQGRKESDRNFELASPSRRLLDDGTVTLRIDGQQADFRTSWALLPAARASIEQAFGSQVCAEDADVIGRLFPRLFEAFGDPGPDFHDSETTLHRVQEAGWGAWPVLFARTWPNVLAVSREQLAVLEAGVTRRIETCIVVKAGRLESQSVYEIPETP